MEIKIISPKRLYLQGDISVLEEKIDRSDDEKELDIFPESIIAYPDLVFTLENNHGQYLSSEVKFEQEKLRVVSNTIFYRAAKEAGIKKIQFNLLFDKKIPLDDIIDRFNLEFSPPAIKREYFETFLFFYRTPTQPKTDISLLLWNQRNNSDEFRHHNCLAYKILIETPEKSASIEHELVARLFNENGYLRSINGICDKSWSLGRYIK